jgi:hypothetical protein
VAPAINCWGWPSKGQLHTWLWFPYIEITWKTPNDCGFFSCGKPKKPYANLWCQFICGRPRQWQWPWRSWQSGGWLFACLFDRSPRFPNLFLHLKNHLIEFHLSQAFVQIIIYRRLHQQDSSEAKLVRIFWDLDISLNLFRLKFWFSVLTMIRQMILETRMFD